MKKRGGNLKVSTVAILKAYGKHCKRMKEIARKGKLCEQRIASLTRAFATLLNDENFVSLLEIQKSLKIPKFFHKRITSAGNATS